MTDPLLILYIIFSNRIEVFKSLWQNKIDFISEFDIKERKHDPMVNSLQNKNPTDLPIITVKTSKGTLDQFDFVN
jgi:hypothetical protein